MGRRWINMGVDPDKQRTIVVLVMLIWGMLLGGFVCVVMGGQYKLTDGERLATQWAYDRMVYREGWKEKADRRADSIIRERAKYEVVQKVTGVPWYAVGVLDELEAGGGCCRHLHNGDPLSQRTKHVPAGQPEDGDPPFTWYQSALDALEGHGWTDVDSWKIPDLLWLMEKWNGFGYRSHEVMTPYVWSGSQYHERGKFVADGAFDPESRSNQVGAALLLRSLSERGIVEIPRWTPSNEGGDRDENASGNANRTRGAGASDGDRGSGRSGPTTGTPERGEEQEGESQGTTPTTSGA